MNEKTIIEIYFIVLGIALSCAQIPQIIRLLKRKKSDDVSLLMFYIVGFGMSNWLWYGFYIKAMPIIISNISGLITIIIVIVLTHKYRS